MANLNKYGLKERVIDITPNLKSKYNSMLCRGHEIKAWLDCHDNIEKFVIIDDGDDMFELIDYLAQCDYDDGLIYEVKEQCFKILT